MKSLKEFFNLHFRQPNVHWQLNRRTLPFLLVLLVLMKFLAPYKGWDVLLVGVGGATLLAVVWAYSLSRNLELKREKRFGWAQVGDRLVERFTLSNAGRFPALWIEIDDHSTLPNYSASRGTGVNGHSYIRWHQDTVCGRRGLFYLGPVALKSGDPFGIFTVTQEYPGTMPLLVLPPIVPLPSIEVASGGRSGSERPRPGAFDRTVSAGSVREYVPGDSQRWIHWKTTARRDDLFVRLFDGTPSGDWWILLDMDRHVQAGSGENSTPELGVILAASLADKGLRTKRSVGLVARGDELVWLPPKAGSGQRWEILRALAMVEQGNHTLSTLLHRMEPALGQRTSIVIITPSTSGRWLGDLLPLIQRGAVPTVILLDPASFGATRSVDAIEAQLTKLNIAHYSITQDLLELPEVRPGEQGQWEWKILGTGKAVPVRKVVEARWQQLT
jgi:uncharacterized protein (DUF58 family)